MIVRWRVVELGLHKTEEKGKRAAVLINEHEIQVLLKTRKFRDAQKERRYRSKADNEQGKGGSLAIMRNNKRTQKARPPIDPGPLQIPCQKRPSLCFFCC